MQLANNEKSSILTWFVQNAPIGEYLIHCTGIYRKEFFPPDRNYTAKELLKENSFWVNWRPQPDQELSETIIHFQNRLNNLVVDHEAVVIKMHLTKGERLQGTSMAMLQVEWQDIFKLGRRP